MSGWIRPRDRMPKPEQEVLVLANAKKDGIELIDAYELAAFDGKDGWLLEAFPEWDDVKIEWWMPLPELPKESRAWAILDKMESGLLTEDE